RHKSRRPSNSLDFLLRFCQEKRSRPGAEGPARRERQRRKSRALPKFCSARISLGAIHGSFCYHVCKFAHSQISESAATHIYIFHPPPKAHVFPLNRRGAYYFEASK